MSKHTKAGRRASRRRHHVEIAAEALMAHRGRQLRAWLDTPRGRAWQAQERPEGAVECIARDGAIGLAAWRLAT